jgi:hypothetical protein
VKLIIKSVVLRTFSNFIILLLGYLKNIKKLSIAKNNLYKHEFVKVA